MERVINILLVYFFYLLQVSCQNHGKLSVVADIPPSLEENSGIQIYSDNTLWVIEDNGNKDEIYSLNLKGEITKQFEVKNAKNKDWEDLAKDATRKSIYR